MQADMAQEETNTEEPSTLPKVLLDMAFQPAARGDALDRREHPICDKGKRAVEEREGTAGIHRE